MALIAACQTVATNNAEIAASKKQNLLAQAGFKFITVTTPKQQQAVSQLAQGRVSAVKQMAGTPTLTYETAGPNHIEVDQFDGFGPMGTEQLGNW
ncbi:MAG: hypothetical protein DME87_13890 [Verrucomicrobia bacterium]|nr:MAG: hypothetical protein DME87_13890 [Verrucomicrobiota bacterium]